MILYINACPRTDSRTDKIAKAYLKKIGKPYKELKLTELNLQPLNNNSLEKRTNLLVNNMYDDEMFKYSKEFSNASNIVIAAPFWDYSFPSILKIYLENIYCIGIVSRYDEFGNPVGLCKAKSLVYITTSGGKYDASYSYNYIETLAKVCFGIKETKLIKAENLDIEGNDYNKIIDDVIESL